jgi:hypothetical protein
MKNDTEELVRTQSQQSTPLRYQEVSSTWFR